MLIWEDIASVEPGKPDDSELLHRILTEDEDDIMPPRKSGKEVTKEEANLLRQWIADGGEYEEHWAYRPLQQPSPPALSEGATPEM